MSSRLRKTLASEDSLKSLELERIFLVRLPDDDHQHHQFPSSVLDEEVVGCSTRADEALTAHHSLLSDEDAMTAEEDDQLLSLSGANEAEQSVIDTKTGGDTNRTAKLQSQLRRTLSQLYLMSYNVVDNELLRSITAAVKRQLDLCKAAVGHRVIPRRNRSRIAKQNPGHSDVRHRLTAAKPSRRTKKTSVKQRRIKGDEYAFVRLYHN